jgi:hypothetical protein
MAMMETVHNQHCKRIENDEREGEARALEHFESDIGLNYDAGFGSLLEDTGAADIARTRRDHRIIEE